MLRDPEKTIAKLMHHQKLCFLASIDDAGFPVTRAMERPRKMVGVSLQYFTTNTSSNKVAQLRKNPKASVYYCDRRFMRGVVLLGTVEVLEDADIKTLLWQDGDEKFYPQGAADPDYCVLKFTATSGRYYSNFKSEDFPV